VAEAYNRLPVFTEGKFLTCKFYPSVLNDPDKAQFLEYVNLYNKEMSAEEFFNIVYENQVTNEQAINIGENSLQDMPQNPSAHDYIVNLEDGIDITSSTAVGNETSSVVDEIIDNVVQNANSALPAMQGPPELSAIIGSLSFVFGISLVSRNIIGVTPKVIFERTPFSEWPREFLNYNIAMGKTSFELLKSAGEEVKNIVEGVKEVSWVEKISSIREKAEEIGNKIKEHVR